MALGAPISTLFNKTATITPIGKTQDGVGGQVENEGAAYTLPCRIRALRGDELPILGREGVKSTHKVYFNGSASLPERYRLEIEGIRYDVDFTDNKHLMDHHLEVWVIRRTPHG